MFTTQDHNKTLQNGNIKLKILCKFSNESQISKIIYREGNEEKFQKNIITELRV